MRRLLLALAIATAAPTFLAGCDKIKDLTGDKGDAKKERSDDDDEDDKKSKKKDKSAKGDEKSAKPGGSGGPSAPSAPASGASAAASHLQSDCEVVVTANFAKLLSNPAMTKEIVPLLEEMLSTPAPKDPGTKKLQAFMKSSGLSLKSLHNGAVCAKNVDGGKDDDNWLFLVGGDIKPDSVVAALESSGVLEASDKVIDVDGRKALAAKNGALGQYADGVVALSSTTDIFKAGTATSTAATAVFKIDPGRELAFALSDAFVQRKVKEDKKSPEPFKTVRSLSGFVDLSANKAEMRLGTGSAEDAKKLDGLIALMSGELAKDQKPGSVEAGLLASMKSRTEGNDVIVEVPLPADVLGKAAEMLAAELRKAKTKL